MDEAPESSPSYAGWGYRVGAYLTDFGLAVAAGSVVNFVAGEGDDGTYGALTAVVVWLLVTSVAMAVFEGQTVGKRIAGTRVVVRDRPAGFGISLLRDQLLRVLYIIPLFFLVDSIWAAADSQRQTLRDKIVGSHVVRAGANARRAVVVGVLGPALIAFWVGLSVVRDSGEPTEYPPFERSAFIDSCEDEGESEQYCTCLFDYIEERVPYENSFPTVESEDMREWHPQMRNAMLDGIEACS